MPRWRGLCSKACFPKNQADEWYAPAGWDSSPYAPSEDRDGDEWSFRGRPWNVEASAKFPLFLRKGSDYWNAVLLIGYEGSGGY